MATRVYEVRSDFDAQWVARSLTGTIRIVSPRFPADWQLSAWLRANGYARDGLVTWDLA